MVLILLREKTSEIVVVTFFFPVEGFYIDTSYISTIIMDNG